MGTFFCGEVEKRLERMLFISKFAFRRNCGKGGKGMKKAVQILSAAAIYNSVVAWAVQIAYEQRGYSAIGGEYLLAGAAAVAAYWWIGKGWR